MTGPAGHHWNSTAATRDTFVERLVTTAATDGQAACTALGVPYATYVSWRRRYPEFKARVDLAFAANKTKRSGIPATIDTSSTMADKRLALFKMASYWHHRQILDALETAPAGGVTLVLVPPEHGKSTVVSDCLTIWIAEDPNIRIAYVSEGTGLARKALGKQKRRMGKDGALAFGALHGRFGPFENPGCWTADYFRVVRSDADEQDYTMEARGWNSTIAGSRVDTMVIDDIQSHRSLSQTESMLERVRQDFFSRVGKFGRIVVIGTRVGEGDIYEKMMDEGLVDKLVQLPATTGETAVCELDVIAEVWPTLTQARRDRLRDLGGRVRDLEGNPYRLMPELLEEWLGLPEVWQQALPQLTPHTEPMGCSTPELTHEKPLCPEMWPSHALAVKRRKVGESAWWRNFQQKPRAARDATFTEPLVKGARDPMATLAGWRDQQPGWRRFAALDPAIAGGNSLMGFAANPSVMKVLGASRNFNMARSENIISDIAEHHRLWRFTDLIVEVNAYQKALANDQRLLDLGAKAGFRVVPHTTGVNKLDPDLGVASMAGSFSEGRVLWPWGDQAARTEFEVLEAELMAWRAGVPTRRLRQDTVMSLWFGWLFWQDKVVGRAQQAKGPLRVSSGSPFFSPARQLASAGRW